MKNCNLYIVCFILSTLFFSSCIEDYVPTPEENKQEVVVEGFIEAGEGSLPAYVLLTESIPFISTIELSTFNSLFINDAEVTVNDGTNLVTLTELCLNELPEELRVVAAEVLGVNPDNVELNICAYVDLLDQLDRKEGGQYDLTIKIDDKTITSTTTIPQYVPLTNFRWDELPGIPNDTLARLWVTISDPADEKNFYRFFTEENNEGLIAPFSSIVEDVFFNGEMFEFPLNKAEPRDAEFDPNTFGFYTRGDSIRVKWMTIDEAHFDFWNTLEFSRNNSGPFSSFNRVSSNVDGALGVWGGYAIGFFEDLVPD